MSGCSSLRAYTAGRWFSPTALGSVSCAHECSPVPEPQHRGANLPNPSVCKHVLFSAFSLGWPFAQKVQVEILFALRTATALLHRPRLFTVAVETFSATLIPPWLCSVYTSSCIPWKLLGWRLCSGSYDVSSWFASGVCVRLCVFHAFCVLLLGSFAFGHSCSLLWQVVLGNLLIFYLPLQSSLPRLPIHWTWKPPCSLSSFLPPQVSRGFCCHYCSPFSEIFQLLLLILLLNFSLFCHTSFNFQISFIFFVTYSSYHPDFVFGYSVCF